MSESRGESGGGFAGHRDDDVIVEYLFEYLKCQNLIEMLLRKYRQGANFRGQISDIHDIIKHATVQ